MIRYGNHLTEEEADKLLYQFAQKGLKPSDEFINEGKLLARQVFKKLQTESKDLFRIVKTHIAGSIGKKTNVIQPDLDLVVVINDCLPPFTSVLESFQKILEESFEELQIKSSTIERKTNYSLQFVFNCGIEVDLLPAANLPYQEIHKLIAENPKHYYRYSSSLVERQLDFMKKHQSSFVHIVIRLAKFWLKSLCFGEKTLIGGGTIMELIGMTAAEDEELTMGSQDCRILRAMDHVMRMIMKIKTLKLAYKELEENEIEEGGGKWDMIFLQFSKDPVKDFVPHVIGTEEILNRECFIIEPANPFNDLLKGQSQKVIKKLIRFAKVTSHRIRNFQTRDVTFLFHNMSTGFYPLDILELFEPQPSCLKEFLAGGAPDLYIIGYSTSQTSNSTSSSHCEMKVKRGRENLLSKTKVKLFIENLKWQLLAVVHSAAKLNLLTNNITNAEAIVNKVGKAAANQMLSSLGKTAVAVVKLEEIKSHEKMDVSLIVPYMVGEKTYSVMFSMMWTKPVES